ncbi:MAG: ribosome biogenesis GTP-binding protein YihA/YsxC [Myxococcales bacterium]|nr:ribosome biogenesis GTP-binding protein YihA/YsxC [Myxococcales bacterium]
MFVRDARFLQEARSLAQLPPPIMAEIAFAGRSNVGKSSLINALVGRRGLVRTSSTPGCTLGINFFGLSLGEAELRFVDLPGYGYAKRSKAERRAWGPILEGYLRDRPGLRATIVIVDIRRGLEEEDAQLLAFLEDLGRETVIVATKLDKLRRHERKPALEALGGELGLPVFGFSSIDGSGRDALFAHILECCSLRLDPRPASDSPEPSGGEQSGPPSEASSAEEIEAEAPPAAAAPKGPRALRKAKERARKARRAEAAKGRSPR